MVDLSIVNHRQQRTHLLLCLLQLQVHLYTRFHREHENHHRDSRNQMKLSDIQTYLLELLSANSPD